MTTCDPKVLLSSTPLPEMIQLLLGPYVDMSSPCRDVTWITASMCVLHVSPGFRGGGEGEWWWW